MMCLLLLWGLTDIVAFGETDEDQVEWQNDEGGLSANSLKFMSTKDK